MKKLVIISTASFFLAIGSVKVSDARLLMSNSNPIETTASQTTFVAEWETIKAELEQKAVNGLVQTNNAKASVEQLTDLLFNFYASLKSELADQPQLQNQILPRLEQRGTLAGNMNQLLKSDQASLTDINNIVNLYLQTF